MTRQAGTTQSTSPIGPERFQVSRSAPPERAGASSVGAALLLLAIVVGVPVALVVLGGAPALPTSLPTREQLTATIGVSQVLAVLVWIVWLAWLQFTVCVAVEVPSAVRGVGLPARVPLSGPSQRAARTLVASAVLLVTLAGQASALAPTEVARHDAATITASAGVTSHLPSAQMSAGAAVAAEAVSETAPARVGAGVNYWLGDVQLSADEGRALLGKRVYVVQPPEGRYHDNLWDIAERTLQDGRRYREVFELNRERSQPDGGELTLSRLIYPNWLLVMPEDATTVDRVTARPVEVAPESGAAMGAVPVEGGVTVAEAAAGSTIDGLTLGQGPGATADRVTPERVAAESLSGAAPAVRDFGGLVGAGLLAAGVLGAVAGARRRRRTRTPGDEAVELEVALRIGADPARAARLDAALRSVGASLRAEHRSLPAVYGARIDDHQVALLCSPPCLDPPAPWESHDDGRRWVLPSSADRSVAGARAAVPFPGLVSIGRDEDGADVLVDLEAAQGPIAVVGDQDRALEVVAALAAELATNPWSSEIEVYGAELPPALTALGDRYRESDPITVLEGWAATGHEEDVLTGRTSGGPGASSGRYLLMGAGPSVGLGERIREVTSHRGRAPWGVVCAGAVPGARWTWEVGADTLSVPPLGLTVRPNRLRARDAGLVAELLAPAVDSDPDDDVDRGVRRRADAERPEIPAPVRSVLLDALFAAPVAVRVFGTPDVTGAGPVDAERVPLLTELVVYLALHPDGAHPAVLAGELWPFGVSDEVRDSTLTRAARWLGVGHDGPHLRCREDGRWHLGPEVVLDWDVVLTLLRRARMTPDPRQEREDLADALDVGGSGVLTARPPGRYSWLARARLERRAADLLVDTAHRLSQVCRNDGDPFGATRAARDGLRCAPAAGVLWDDLLLAAHQRGGDEAVEAVAAELDRAVSRGQVSYVPAPTLALLEDLLPGRSRGLAGA